MSIEKARLTKATLSDWLSVIGWIVSEYSFTQCHGGDWFKKFLEKRNRYHIYNVEEYYTKKNEFVLLEEFRQYCFSEMEKIAGLVKIIKTSKDLKAVVRAVLACYRIVQGSNYLKENSALKQFSQLQK
jgi:hypothetical protein